MVAMALLMRFTVPDLHRIHVRAEPDPAGEILLSLRVLQGAGDRPGLTVWRELVRARLFTAPSALADDTDGTGPDQIGRLARDYHRVALGPWWARIRRAVAATAASLTGAEPDRLLSTLHPDVVWRRPVLRIAGPGPDVEVRPDGSGLHLLPSVFAVAPMVRRAAGAPPVLVFPIDASTVWGTAPSREPDGSLAALLGATRAAVLAAAAEGLSTSDLAGRLRISVATASYHTGVLRDAGLITTVRHGPSVAHRLRPKGALLLHRDGTD